MSRAGDHRRPARPRRHTSPAAFVGVMLGGVVAVVAAIVALALDTTTLILVAALLALAIAVALVMTTIYRFVSDDDDEPRHGADRR